MWQPDAVRVVAGIDRLATYHKTETSYRRWCTDCGGHVMTEHPAMGLVDVDAATLPELPFRPALHVHYQESVLPIRDGLPKMKDVPADLGRSGQTMAE